MGEGASHWKVNVLVPDSEQVEGIALYSHFVYAIGSVRGKFVVSVRD